MNLLENFENPQKKQNKNYFVHLVRIAKADNVVTNNELELLVRIGKNLGFTDPEIDKLIETTGKFDYEPPYELSKRFNQVYEIVKMTLADEVIDKSEMRLASGFATISGFTDNEIPKLLVLLISGIKQGLEEDYLFEVYKKEKSL
jgi:hypothetical protein